MVTALSFAAPLAVAASSLVSVLAVAAALYERISPMVNFSRSPEYAKMCSANGECKQRV
jgi:hypothetical protein